MSFNKILIPILVVLFAWTEVTGQTDINVTFIHSGKEVFGTLSLPAGNGPHPVVIIAPGSGPNDRDSTIPLIGGNSGCLYPDLEGQTLRPYKDLAQALVDSGYSVLRYDKLEYTYPNNLGEITFEKLWLPVSSAIDYVKTRPEIDPENVILLGHSEGSSLIPFIARNTEDIRALISVAGPRTPFDSLLAAQLVDFARWCNGDTVLAESQAAQILAYFDIIRSNQWNTLTPGLFGVPAATWYDYILVVDSVSINYNISDLPTLFIGLGEDINVPLSELMRFENEVTAAEDFWVIPGLNHFMTPNDDPSVSPKLTDTIIYWLRELDVSTSTKDDRQLVAEIDLFPNPASDLISVVPSGDLIGLTTLRVYDFVGKRVISRTFHHLRQGTPIQLSLRDLSPGMYVLVVDSDQGRVVKKMIKE